MWLLNEDVLRRMQAAELAGCMPTADAQRAHEKEIEAATLANGGPRNMVVAGSTAEIRIEGVLTKKPDLFAMFFGDGNMTY